MSKSSQYQKRLLISAYACAPDRGAEPGVGWNLIAYMAGEYGYELTVITRTKHQPAIEASNDPRVKDVNWIYVDPPEWLISFKRGALGLKAYYLLWQKKMHAAQCCAAFKSQQRMHLDTSL